MRTVDETINMSHVLEVDNNFEGDYGTFLQILYTETGKDARADLKLFVGSATGEAGYTVTGAWDPNGSW